MRLKTKSSVKPRKKKPSARKKWKRGSAEALLSFKGQWHGPPGELDRLLSEIQRLRDREVRGHVSGK